MQAIKGLQAVVFNQNCHYTFRNYPVPPLPGTYTPYTDPNVIGTMVLSPYCARALRSTFPGHPVHVVPHGIDPVRFPLGEYKRKQIAYMPRKHPDEAQQVFGYLRYRGALDGWDVVAIDGLTEAQTAQTLRDSMVFFALGYPEGGTLPPFEAMASGCVVVGYGGFSSDHWIKEFGGVLVPSANTMAFVDMAEPVLRWPIDKLVAWGKDSRRLVLEGLSMAKEREALLAFWTQKPIVEID